MRRKLRWIGLESQKEFDADQVDPATARGLSRAAKKIWGLLESAPYQMKTVNGWLLPLNLGRYGTDYDTRAFVAFVGLGALWSEDAIYPSAFVDGDGRPLDGACDYRLHFDRGPVPLPQRCLVDFGVPGELLRAKPRRALWDYLRDSGAIQPGRII